MDKKINLIDTTLREGEQSPGVTFTLAQKKRILDKLALVGIEEVEIGISSKLHPCAGPLITYCRKYQPTLTLSLWSRCRTPDILHAASLGPDICSLSVPASKLLLEHKIGKSAQWMLQKMKESILLAKSKGLRVAVGFEDATRADLPYLLDLARTAQQAGAERIRLADTVGIFSPAKTSHLIQELAQKLTNCTIGFHAHNDFGMATANSIAALEAGGSHVDVTVLGLGERTGCARLEEVAGFLSLASKQASYHTESLKDLAKYVSHLTTRPITTNRPIVGEEIFTCETGLHLQCLQSAPNTYEPFDPKRVSANRKLIYGSKIGKRALEKKLHQLGKGECTITETTLMQIRGIASKLNRPLTDKELHLLAMT